MLLVELPNMLMASNIYYLPHILPLTLTSVLSHHLIHCLLDVLAKSPIHHTLFVPTTVLCIRECHSIHQVAQVRDPRDSLQVPPS